MRHKRLIALGAVAVLALTACAEDNGNGNGDDAGTDPTEAPEFAEGSTMARLAEAGSIRIGTKYDQPGFGLADLDGAPQGFDVEIGKILAGELGIAEDGIAWSEAPSAVREEVLERDEVDLVIATYTINDERKQRIDFAGPYYIAGQHIMVLADNDTITGPESFEDGESTTCSVQGSTPSENIREYLANEAEQLVLFDVYSRCVDALVAGDVDSVTTDNVILLGFMAADEGAFKLVESGTFTEEPYGIGVQQGDDDFRDWVNDVLEEIVADGRYNDAWARTAGVFDPELPTPPTVDRY